MAYTVNWTLKAKLTYIDNLDYLSEEWDDKVFHQFIDRVEEIIQTIKNQSLFISIS